MDVCKQHTGGGLCVSSLALQAYLNSDGKLVYRGNAKAAIELNLRKQLFEKGVWGPCWLWFLLKIQPDSGVEGRWEGGRW